MTTFTNFAVNCKMRHDFGDMIQVRYTHPNGEYFDTWVSGNEALQRVKSAKMTERIRSLSKLDLDAIRKSMADLPRQTKSRVGSELTARISDEVEDFLGSNLVSESLADALRGSRSQEDSDPSHAQRWRLLLQDERIRFVVLHLAWIQLEGSLPDRETDAEPNDWM